MIDSSISFMSISFDGSDHRGGTISLTLLSVLWESYLYNQHYLQFKLLIEIHIIERRPFRGQTYELRTQFAARATFPRCRKLDATRKIVSRRAATIFFLLVSVLSDIIRV
jgi:hypothetical protein